MAKKPQANAADRPVMLSADSARRVGRMLSAYEGGDRAITPYVVPNGVIDNDQTLVKYFKLTEELGDCLSVEGKEVVVTGVENGCPNTVDVVPETTATLHEMSFSITRYNITRNKKLDTKLPVDTVVVCMALPSTNPTDIEWRIVDILSCQLGQDATEEWCDIIGGVYLNDLSTETVTYGLAINSGGCIVREVRGCGSFGGLSIADLNATAEPAYVIGIDANGCLCKVNVQVCVPSSPGGGG